MVRNVSFDSECAAAPLQRSLRRHCDAQTFEAVRDAVPTLIQTVRDTPDARRQTEIVRRVLEDQCRSLGEGDALDDDQLDEVSRFVVNELQRMGQADAPAGGYQGGVDSSHWLG